MVGVACVVEGFFWGGGRGQGDGGGGRVGEESYMQDINSASDTLQG